MSTDEPWNMSNFSSPSRFFHFWLYMIIYCTLSLLCVLCISSITQLYFSDTKHCNIHHHIWAEHFSRTITTLTSGIACNLSFIVHISAWRLLYNALNRKSYAHMQRSPTRNVSTCTLSQDHKVVHVHNFSHKIFTGKRFASLNGNCISCIIHAVLMVESIVAPFLFEASHFLTVLLLVASKYVCFFHPEVPCNSLSSISSILTKYRFLPQFLQRNCTKLHRTHWDRIS